jgi:hypothetical protein
MLSDAHVNIRSGARPEVQAYAVPPTLACGLACAHCDARSVIRPDARAYEQGIPQGCFCEKGLSALQINVLFLAHRAGTRVTPYARIARQLASEFDMPQQAESVRGVVNRLAARGFLRHQQARDGSIRGVRFIIIPELLCPYIMRPKIDDRPDARHGAQADARPAHSVTPSILEEIERKNTLSISSGKEEEQKTIRLLEALSEEDIAFHWPELSRQGFGTDQIRQIIIRLAQVNIGTGRIMQGLTHAEWELSAGRMRDKYGNPVSSPASWVFKILATQGYYPRPEGYRSPQEQAEQDAAEELTRQTAAYEARQTAEAEAWIIKLSPDERNAILGPSDSAMRIPDTVVLRRHFRSEIWPRISEKNL